MIYSEYFRTKVFIIDDDADDDNDDVDVWCWGHGDVVVCSVGLPFCFFVFFLFFCCFFFNVLSRFILNPWSSRLECRLGA